ncbi:unnamed protein product [Porites lobata]|uniref:WSC domain-containing protein n=1 Tax=Porites lobata TaxID=104759 RepID=A0ABN8MS04_9CNID|nr:unnamed protein product [Porites lobata]
MMQRSKGICLPLVWNTCFTLTCLIMLIHDKVSAGVSYKKVGCYKDNGQKKRPLPQLLFTDRHYLSSVYSGRKFIKDSFDRSYLDDLVGRCASKCKQLGYDIFGIGKFAECYSGDGAYKTYKNDGPTKQCYTSKYQPCNFECESVPCAGSIHTIFVYKLGTPRRLPRVLLRKLLHGQVLLYLLNPRSPQVHPLNEKVYPRAVVCQGQQNYHPEEGPYPQGKRYQLRNQKLPDVARYTDRFLRFVRLSVRRHVQKFALQLVA